jgi:8-oxo-dGTP pyrophosphatase MutT (NUDIX family)
LREAEEEIGLDPALVSVLTVLEPFLSKVSKILVLLRNITYATTVRFYQPLLDEETRKRSVSSALCINAARE